MANISTLLDSKSVPSAKPALIQPSKGLTYSYGMLRDEMNRVAYGLSGLGIRKGDRVCIYLDSSPEYLISYFAIWRIGAVAVPANIVYRGEELLHAVRDAGASAIITDTDSVRFVDQVRCSTPSLDHIVCVNGGHEGTVSWESFRTCPEGFRATHCSLEDLCHLQYTAGTTGRPKGAMLSHGNWMAALDAEREALRLLPDDIYLGIYPMGHVGISWGIAALRAGGTWVMMERFDPDTYVAYAERYQATVLAGMPPVIHSLVNSPAGTEPKLGYARVMISGGGQLLPSVWEAFDRRFHIPVANSYGLSETIVIGSGTTTLPEYPQLTRNFQSVGVPVGYTEIKIVDSGDATKELGAGDSGEIAIRGPAVARGYWQMPEATEAVFLDDGWFLTGDIGHIDEEGILYITDRKKDMIITSGWKVYPTEVENVLIRHPDVSDVAVFGIPDERKGETVVACIVAGPGGTPEPEDLDRYCREHLAGYKVPKNYFFTDTLPRMHGWKLLRRTLREKYGR